MISMAPGPARFILKSALITVETGIGKPQMRFSKYHALGNDYIVVHPDELTTELGREQIIRICQPHFGVGSDGLLIGPFPSDSADFRLQLFNPDGGEFEKSGNGLRIFCRYLWDRGQVQENEFTIDTPGGIVKARVAEDGSSAMVEMGIVSFHSEQISVAGQPREVLDETITVGGIDYRFCAATIGNPHCVVIPDSLTADLAKAVGPVLETDPRFPNRTNVQFLEVVDRQNIRIEIWERGVGYTLASGSSSCAAAAVAHRLGYCDREISVHCPGGVIGIDIADNYAVKMTGSVTKICDGELSAEMFD